jgi:hypothetical protein
VLERLRLRRQVDLGRVAEVAVVALAGRLERHDALADEVIADIGEVGMDGSFGRRTGSGA